MIVDISDVLERVRACSVADEERESLIADLRRLARDPRVLGDQQRAALYAAESLKVQQASAVDVGVSGGPSASEIEHVQQRTTGFGNNFLVRVLRKHRASPIQVGRLSIF